MKSENTANAIARRYIASLLVLLLAIPNSASACGPWQLCQLDNAAHQVVDRGKDAVNGAVAGVKKGLEGVGNVLKGGGQVLTGHFGDGWKTMQDGGKEIINGALQIAVTGVVTVATMADPLIGAVFFGQPSPLQGVAKFIYDTISRWKGHPDCNPQEQINRLMIVPKKTLDDPSRLLGAATTPAKYLSSLFDGYGAWELTGCDGVGIGRPIREGQISTDGLWTVDVAITDFDIQGVKSPPGRYIRLEIFPGVPAHDSVANHTPTAADVIRFRGPMVWDKDKDSDHPYGHMEMHPLAALEFGVQGNVDKGTVLNPQSLDFGNQPVRQPSEARSVLLVNSSHAALTIQNLSVLGSGANDFSQTNNCSAPIAAQDG